LLQAVLAGADAERVESEGAGDARFDAGLRAFGQQRGGRGLQRAGVGLARGGQPAAERPRAGATLRVG